MLHAYLARVFTHSSYWTADGQLKEFLQKAGFPQGDPLAPFWSCLVLWKLLHDLDPELRARAAQRLALGDSGDDGKGGLSRFFAYMDDNQHAPDLRDVHFIFDFFEAQGPALGLTLNRTKCKLLAFH